MRYTLKRAFSLVETTLSTLMVGVLFVASMQTLAWSHKTSAINMQEDIAQSIAQELLDEVLMQDYQDNERYNNGNNITDLGRPYYKSVSNYNGYHETQIKDKAGNIRTELPGYQRKVIVQYIDPSDRTVCATDLGMRRIQVSVLYNTDIIYELVGFKYDTEKPF